MEGDFYEPGPATVWMRLAMPLVSGEQATLLQRAAAVSGLRERTESGAAHGLAVHQR